MRIAINTVYLQNIVDYNENWLIEALCKIWATQYPEHSFIIVTHKDAGLHFKPASNVQVLAIAPAITQVVKLKWWLDVKLPLALKKHQPDVLLQPFGMASMASSIPQVLIAKNVGFIQYPKFFASPTRLFLQYFTSKFFNKVARIVVVNEAVKQTILEQYQVDANKINVVLGAAQDIYTPVGFDTKQEVKAANADGREYFLFVGGMEPQSNLMGVLKAFSQFKKWQKSNMKLLIVNKGNADKTLTEKLESYRYRDDVVVLNHVDEMQMTKLIAAAYAFVYTPFIEGWNLPIMEAMQSGVPVIASDTASAHEIGKDSALYANPKHHEEIANSMKLLYRDENLRSSLIEKGLQQAVNYSLVNTAHLLWQSIEKMNMKSAV